MTNYGNLVLLYEIGGNQQPTFSQSNPKFVHIVSCVIQYVHSEAVTELNNKNPVIQLLIEKSSFNKFIF